MESIDASPQGGFLESEHTADLALEVWAPSLAALFINAAKGMFALSGLQPKQGGPQTVHHIRLQALDDETLLVNFLSELLYLSERHRIGFIDYHVNIDGDRLVANVTAIALHSLEKAIKAVTFHNLAIHNDLDGYHVRVVFDI